MKLSNLIATMSVALLACSGSNTSTGAGGATGGSSSSLPTTTASTTSLTSASGAGSTGVGGAGSGATVFLILMENNNWSAFKNSSSAPYINQTLLVQGAHAEQYYNPPSIHPSEPNYLWLEAGTNFGVLDDNDPSVNSQTTTSHLVSQLESAGIGWRSYQEDITGTTCPLVGVANYAPKHDPMVFFQDVTNGNNSASPRCIQHVRPYSELAGDLASGTVASYNFITPNLCHDGHNTCPPENDDVKQTDDWLAAELPKILGSAAYQHNGIVLITWDEGEGADGPIGLIALSNLVKPGYSNSVKYDHSSTLKTIQTIFNLSPLLGAAANPGTNDLADLFVTLP